MGSIQLETPFGNEAVGMSSTAQADEDGFHSFEIIGLAASQTVSPTGMREEILLLAWMIVLLRTKDDGQLCCHWAYNTRVKHNDSELLYDSLSMNEFTAGSGLKSLIGQSAATIACKISVHSRHLAFSGPASILLSTNSPQLDSEKLKEQGELQLEICFVENYLKIRPIQRPKNMQSFTLTHLMETLVDIIKICLSDPNAAIEDTMRPTSCDLDKIWGWNHLLPPAYQSCMHDLISEQAQIYSDKVAISSWDGTLTYTEIEQFSTYVAASLKQMGVESQDFVPICFEKSRWTVVAVIGAMKVGATFVLMDPTLPLARLQNMAEQVSAKTIMSSREQHDLTTSIISNGKHLVIESELFKQSDYGFLPILTGVSPSTLMYIIFTSGSTGTPKGVQISHETYTSSAIPRAKAVGYTRNSRVLDFASYAFDVSIDSMLLTLANGGCLCIPSDDDRLNDINGAMRKMQVNYAGLTPSVARILDQDVIASLSGLGLGGEAVSVTDVALWGRITRIVIGYGPCECTIGCTINSNAATGRDYISIGKGNGASIWIVDPNDHELLLPFGAVGELLVEGPIVGHGYLNDPEKTAASFIKDPSWLVRGHKSYKGRGGTLYRTGDLGKFDPDGSGGIVFVGRQDTQVKLRGQRVELSEIESQLRARLPADAM